MALSFPNFTACDTSTNTPTPLSNLTSLTRTALDAIRNAEEQVGLLARERTVHKMSNNRATSVARELKELRKVLALYGC